MKLSVKRLSALLLIGWLPLLLIVGPLFVAASRHHVAVSVEEHQIPEDEANEFILDVADGDVGVTDPHDAKWSRIAKGIKTERPICQWKGCGEPATCEHHWITWRISGEIGHKWLRYHPKNVLSVCFEHHKQLHNIGNGGSWQQFNLDAGHDCLVGKWNSRGLSRYPGDDQIRAILLKDLGPPRDEAPANWNGWQLKAAKSPSKTVLAP